MSEQLNNILVFATNIKTEIEKQKVALLLNANTEIIKWNIDQEDIDCVLRIVSNTLFPAEITALISTQKFECIELNS